MKKYIISSVFGCLLGMIPAFAQSEEVAEEVNDLKNIAIGIRGGLATPYTDVKANQSGYYVGLLGKYKFNNYLYGVLDLGIGNLKAGDKSDLPVSKLPYFSNQYFYGSVTAQFMPLNLIKKRTEALDYLGGLYIGTGLGFVKSNVTSQELLSKDYGRIEEYKDIDFLIPVQIGFDIPVAKMSNNRSVNLELNYRFNFTFGDYLDGHKPLVSKNSSNDVFNMLTLGVTYNF